MRISHTACIRVGHERGCDTRSKPLPARLLISLSVALALSGAPLADAEEVGPRLAAQTMFNIPAQSLGASLKQLADQAGIQILFEERIVSGLQAPAIRTSQTVLEALSTLLDATGLEYTARNETVAVRKKASATKPSPTGYRANGASMRLAQAQPSGVASDGDSTGVIDPQTGSRIQLEEVIVSAQKRDERIQEVPVPVTALSPESLTGDNRSRIQDYFSNVPGLNVMPSIQSQQTLSIRGVTTGSGNPTVGVTVDDAPYGSSTNIGGGRGVPDIDPGDLARVEVLRGPQGTLYGANSLGGLLKFVTLDPSTDQLRGRVQAGTSRVQNGDDLGYNLRGSVNAPVAESVAIRASAFTRRDAGYIDNVQTGEEGINQADASGGRAALLWRLSDRFSLKLSALFQRVEGDGSVSADPALGDLRQSRLRDTGWYDRKAQAYGATVTGKLGSVELTSISGFNVNSYSDSFDLGYALSGTAQALYGAAFSGVSLLSTNRTEKFTQELRFAGPIGSRFDWLAGVFYTNEDSFLEDHRIAVDPATGASPGRVTFTDFLTTFEEAALFANLTWRLTDRFDMQFGGRQSEIGQSYEQLNLSATGVRTDIPELNTDASAFTFLVTPRLRLSPQLMVYARLASGYRVGGPNINPGGVVPEQYRPDKTQNYELGLKADLFDGRLLLDASVYHIDWKDIQLNLVLNTFNFTTNGSQARSRGVELSAQVRPLPGLEISSWTVWNAAELTEPLPAGSAGTPVGAAGERLPITARFSANLAVDQEFALTERLNGFVGGSFGYMGDRMGPFRSVPVREVFPSYTQIDLRAGVRHDTWTASLFGTNLGDKRGRLYGGLGANPPTAYTYIQPRTYGLSITKLF
jgi:iron complex outermembrane recepter protein